MNTAVWNVVLTALKNIVKKIKQNFTVHELIIKAPLRLVIKLRVKTDNTLKINSTKNIHNKKNHIKFRIVE